MFPNLRAPFPFNMSRNSLLATFIQKEIGSQIILCPKTPPQLNMHDLRDIKNRSKTKSTFLLWKTNFFSTQTNACSFLFPSYSKKILEKILWSSLITHIGGVMVDNVWMGVLWRTLDRRSSLPPSESIFPFHAWILPFTLFKNSE